MWLRRPSASWALKRVALPTVSLLQKEGTYPAYRRPFTSFSQWHLMIIWTAVGTTHIYAYAQIYHHTRLAAMRRTFPWVPQPGAHAGVARKVMIYCSVAVDPQQDGGGGGFRIWTLAGRQLVCIDRADNYIHYVPRMINCLRNCNEHRHNSSKGTTVSQVVVCGQLPAGNQQGLKRKRLSNSFVGPNGLRSWW